jgi:hypothetical protein
MTWRGQAAVLRTWGDPWLVGPDQTYLGGDVRMMIARFGTRSACTDISTKLLPRT